VDGMPLIGPNARAVWADRKPLLVVLTDYTLQ